MSSTAPRSRPTPELIEADVEREREELMATVTQLHSRPDMKARVRRKITQRPGVTAAAVIATVALVGLLIRRARH